MTKSERSTEEMKSRMSQYEEKLPATFDAQSADISNELRDVHPSKIIDPDSEDSEFFEDFKRVIDDATLPHAEDRKDVEVLVSDNYIGMELALSRGGDGATMHASVRKRLHDEEGKPIGNAHTNPLLDSRKYDIEYADGHIEELTANTIAENLIAQVDEEGHRQMMLGEIIDDHPHKMSFPRVRGHM